MSNRIFNGLHQQIEGFYKASVVDGTTNEVVWEQPEWNHNLILNQGMDEVYSRAITNLTTFAVSGFGSRPNSIDGGSSQITQSGANLALVVNTGLSDFTSSTSTYSSRVQTGDIIKYNGTESMVTSVINGSNLLVTPSYTFTNGKTFTIWKTSQVGVESEVSRSTSYFPGAGNCGSTTNVNVVTHRRSYDFPNEIMQQSYNEAGVAWASSSPTTVFSRFLLSPAIVVAAGFHLRLTYDLQTTWLPATVQYKTASIGNWPVAPATNTIGSESLQKLFTSTVDTNGATIIGAATLDPYYTTTGDSSNWLSLWISPDSTPLAAFGSAVDRGTNAAVTVDGVVTKAAYAGAGSYFCDKSGLFNTSQANRTDLACVGLGNNNGSANNTNQVYAFRFNQTQSKSSSQTLSFTFRWTWTRVLA